MEFNEMIEKLTKWLFHKADCNLNRIYHRDYLTVSLDCTCGLDEILTKLKSFQTEHSSMSEKIKKIRELVENTKAIDCINKDKWVLANSILKILDEK
jgi:predicted DNA-binding ArsR family transcriptional regulator